MWVHRAPRGPRRCTTSSATGEPFGNRGAVAGLAPQDDLGSPWIDERATEAVELTPVVITPQDGGAARFGSFEDAILAVVVGDEDVDPGASTARQIGVG